MVSQCSWNTLTREGVHYHLCICNSLHNFSKFLKGHILRDFILLVQVHMLMGTNKTKVSGVFFYLQDLLLKINAKGSSFFSPNDELLFYCTLNWQQFISCGRQILIFLLAMLTPVLWKFCNQILLNFKVRFPRDTLFLYWTSRLGSQCKNFFGIIGLQFMDHPSGGSMMGLIVTSSKRAYANTMPPRTAAASDPVPTADKSL